MNASNASLFIDMDRLVQQSLPVSGDNINSGSSGTITLSDIDRSINSSESIDRSMNSAGSLDFPDAKGMAVIKEESTHSSTLHTQATQASTQLAIEDDDSKSSLDNSIIIDIDTSNPKQPLSFTNTDQVNGDGSSSSFEVELKGTGSSSEMDLKGTGSSFEIDSKGPGLSSERTATSRRSSFDKSIMIDVDRSAFVHTATGRRVSFFADEKGVSSRRSHSTAPSKYHQSLGFRTNFAATGKAEFNRNFRVSKNPTEMKLERIEAFFYNHGMEIGLGVLFLSLNLMMASHGAYQFSKVGGWTTDNDILRVTLPIARAGGRLVTLNCAILLLTACKYLWTLVRKYIAPVIPIGFPLDEIMPKYHRVVALTIIFSGCVIHTIPQIVNYASRSISIDQKGMKIWTFGNGFATKQLLLTGTLLTIIFSTFFLTTLKSFRKTAAGFRWFWTFHITGIALAYPLLIIHGSLRGYPIFLYFALLPLAMYLFDVSMRRKNIYSAKVLRWRVHDDEGQQITELVLECPKGFSYTPGQYAELKFAPVSTREWHPFTIASAPPDKSDDEKESKDSENSHEIVFYIKNAGRWTEALMEYASCYDLTKARKTTNILIRGPHGAPAMNYSDYKHIIVIGSGVGVTPLLSIWNYLLNQGKSVQARRDSQSTSASFNPQMMMMEKSKMEKSMTLFHESATIFNDHSRSKEFLMDFSRSIDFLESYSLQLGSFENFHLDASLDILDEENEVRKPSNSSESVATTVGKARLKCILLAKLCESMMVSVPVFALFVLGETVAICLRFAGWYLAANAIASALSVLAFVIHGTTLVVWGVAVGRLIYFRLFKFWIEYTIIFVNCFALWYSIQGCRMARGHLDDDALDYSTASFISIGFVIALQAIRIFHIFYLTLKPPTLPSKNDTKEKRGSIKRKGGEVEFLSVDGIVINRKYSNMKFAAKAILPKILQEGLSDVFSMEFYGTREKPKEKDDDEEKITEHSLVGRMMGSVGANITVRESVYYSTHEKDEPPDDLFCPGRPDWHMIFLKAISKAYTYSTDNDGEGESVGVFFCGSPAIAKALKLEAKKVTAQHQFAMQQLHGKRSKCKIIVHSENF